MKMTTGELWDLVQEEQIIYTQNKRRLKEQLDRKTKRKYKKRCKQAIKEMKRYLDLLVKNEEE